jgi:anti-sigma B factor antagonist
MSVDPLVLQLAGQIDVAQAPSVVAQGERLLAGGEAGQCLVVDLGSVEFLDSSGLSALLRLRRDASERGIDISLRDVPRSVGAVLKLAGLEQVLPVEQN